MGIFSKVILRRGIIIANHLTFEPKYCALALCIIKTTMSKFIKFVSFQNI